MGIWKTYDDVLSNPHLIKESWEMKQLIEKVWEEKELEASDWDFFNFEIQK